MRSGRDVSLPERADAVRSRRPARLLEKNEVRTGDQTVHLVCERLGDNDRRVPLSTGDQTPRLGVEVHTE